MWFLKQRRISEPCAQERRERGLLVNHCTTKDVPFTEVSIYSFYHLHPYKDSLNNQLKYRDPLESIIGGMIHSKIT